MTKIVYEKTECSRCGGCGHYSYNQMTGSTCFKCQGSGTQLTRNGRAAMKKVREFLDANYTVAARDLVNYIGRQIMTTTGYRTVVAIVDKRDADGNKKYATDYMVETPKCGYCCSPDDTYRVRPTTEQFNNEVVPYARRFKGAEIIED
jgi:hypothetical protein